MSTARENECQVKKQQDDTDQLASLVEELQINKAEALELVPRRGHRGLYELPTEEQPHMSLFDLPAVLCHDTTVDDETALYRFAILPLCIVHVDERLYALKFDDVLIQVLAADMHTPAERHIQIAYITIITVFAEETGLRDQKLDQWDIQGLQDNVNCTENYGDESSNFTLQWTPSKGHCFWHIRSGPFTVTYGHEDLARVKGFDLSLGMAVQSDKKLVNGEEDIIRKMTSVKLTFHKEASFDDVD